MHINRRNFPFLAQQREGIPLVYFDNAATTHKPRAVIDAISTFYATDYAATHRSMYALAEKTTQAVEDVRKQVAHFIGADADEIIFTKGTTEGINFIASTWAREHIKAGDEILLTELEHHANILPWQQCARERGAVLKYIPVNEQGTLQVDLLPQLLTRRTKLVSFVHTSHALGTINDCAYIIKAAHAVGAVVLVDAAQAVGYQTINVRALDCDFLVFSGHKMVGPTGVGILYIKRSVQSQVPPYQFGGGMVFEADYQHATWLPAPHCYEAGTLPLAEIIGLGAAIKYIKADVESGAILRHVSHLCQIAIEGLLKIPGIRIVGPVEQLKNSGHLVSFIGEGYHPHDVGAYLDKHGICVRTGHYCAQPLAQRLGISGSVRVSFYAYNTVAEVQYFLKVMRELAI
jgi:cysteine desulfurase / selenocysteine lyase